MVPQMTPDVTDEIAAFIDGFERLEDISVSPSGARVALVDFVLEQIYVLDVTWRDDGAGPPVPVIRQGCAFTSSVWSQPHGLAFIDDDHLMIASRGSGLHLFATPRMSEAPDVHLVEPLLTLSHQGGFGAKVKTPGSVAVRRLGDGIYELFVCNNHWHFVSAHVLEMEPRPRLRRHRKVIEAGMRFPEGAAFSPDGSLVALADHTSDVALIYQADDALGPRTAPLAVLTGMVSSHALCFTPAGSLLAVDGASPYLFCFEPPPGGWRGRIAPSHTVEMMDQDHFLDGRLDSRDGGIKGVALDPSGRVLLTARRFDSLRFHDLDAVLARSAPADGSTLIRLRAARDLQLRMRHSEMLARRWDLWGRAKLTGRHWRYLLGRTRLRATRLVQPARTSRAGDHEDVIARLRAQNESSSEPLVAEGGPTVSLTTYGDRTAIAFLAIEAIAAGTLKPGRVVLWHADPDVVAHPPPSLGRLVERGLEIRLADDVRGHKKYFPYVMTQDIDQPLVTADDDALYPSDWLDGLVAANRRRPDAVHAYCVLRMLTFQADLMPYIEWPQCEGTEPSHANFAIGVSGVIYPPEVLARLRSEGDGFRDCSLENDDIWLKVNALRAGIPVAQVAKRPRGFQPIPGTQDVTLTHENVWGGRNQYQLRRAFSATDIEVVAESGAAVDASGAVLRTT